MNPANVANTSDNTRPATPAHQNVRCTPDASGVTTADQACAARCQASCKTQHGGAGNTCKNPGGC